MAKLDDAYTKQYQGGTAGVVLGVIDKRQIGIDEAELQLITKLEDGTPVYFASKAGLQDDGGALVYTNTATTGLSNSRLNEALNELRGLAGTAEFSTDPMTVATDLWSKIATVTFNDTKYGVLELPITLMESVSGTDTNSCTLSLSLENTSVNASLIDCQGDYTNITSNSFVMYKDLGSGVVDIYAYNNEPSDLGGTVRWGNPKVLFNGTIVNYDSSAWSSTNPSASWVEYAYGSRSGQVQLGSTRVRENAQFDKDVNIDGFTAHGSGNTPTKTKVISGTTASASSTTIAQATIGVTFAKYVNYNVIIEDSTSGRWTGAGMVNSSSPTYFSAYVEADGDLYIGHTDARLQGQPYRLIVDYVE